MKYILGLDNNLLYIGRKSVRTSLYKIHKWVRANDGTLMKLRLQSWMGKGFRKWNAQADEIQADTLLKEYILINSIKTRPINRVDIYNRPYYEQHFRLDSGFYDITLLKDASENAPTNVVYLGVQNRRTDPLIYDAVGDTMKFTPTAEFDQHVLSADTAVSHYWQSLWWRRQGAREINIPINCDPYYVDGYYIFAKELGVDDTAFKNQNFWLNDKYHHWIDTVIKPREWLISRHLPGEGKLIKMDIHNLAEAEDTTIYAIDTCTGCYWANRHLRIEEMPMDSNGCWNVIITNNSNCVYTSLHLLMKEFSDNFEAFTFESDPFDTISYGSNHYFYKELALGSGASDTIRICGDPSISYSYQYMLGTILLDSVVADTGAIYNKTFIGCSPLTKIITTGSCCDSIDIERGEMGSKTYSVPY